MDAEYYRIEDNACSIVNKAKEKDTVFAVLEQPP
jgi:hypothetical protein